MIEEKFSVFFFCKRRLNLTGALNEDILPFSPPFLALEQASLYCLTIFKF